MFGQMSTARLVDSLFGPRFYPHVFDYLDGILIVSDNFSYHLFWVEYILPKLAVAALKMNREKCEFCCWRVLYLEYLFDSERLRPVKQFHNFLGMVEYNVRFLGHDYCIKGKYGSRTNYIVIKIGVAELSIENSTKNRKFFTVRLECGDRSTLPVLEKPFFF